MTRRSVKPGAKFRRAAWWNHAKPISRGECWRIRTRTRRASESEGSGAEMRVKAREGQSRGPEGEGVKRKEQAIRRAAGDRIRGEGVAIFH